MLFLALIAVLGWYGWLKYKEYEAAYPELFPWTELSLTDPVGPYTDDKLAALAPARCAALLGELGLGDATGIVRTASEAQCGYVDGVKLGAYGRPDYGDLTTSCSVAAALSLWERETVQPAAEAHFDSEVVAIETFGSYSCRRLYGRADGPWSEHATANAVDIAAFRLEDGTRIAVLDDWDGAPERSAFLRDVRDGACNLFRTTLSPDYNEAHADHLHLDMARGRPAGWSMCR
nr:extensin family protein [Sphingomicrobium sp. B8]